MKILTPAGDNIIYAKWSLNFPQVNYSEIYTAVKSNITFADIEENLKKELKRLKSKEIISLGFDSEIFYDDETITKKIVNVFTILRQSGFPLMVASSVDSVLQFMDLLKLQTKNYCQVFIKIPSFDNSILQVMQPGFPLFEQRLNIVKTLNDNNISAGVLISPVMPRINDSSENFKNIIEASAKHSAKFIMYQKLFSVAGGAKENFLRNIELRFPHLYDYYNVELLTKDYIKSQSFMELTNVFVRTAGQFGISTRPEEYRPPKQLSLF